MSDHHRSRRPRSRTRGREKRRHRDRTPDDELRQQLLLLRERVIALEKPSVSSPHRVDTPLPPSVSRAGSRDEAPPARPGSAAERPQLQGTPPPPPPSDSQSSAMTIADKIADAIKSINYPVRSNHFYISNFDPSLHDIDVWCEEVDRAKLLNGWSDNECLSRIGNCLKGDARNWLNEWVTQDRSWSNFKKEFIPLCPRRLDIANILFDVMIKNSDNYPTYSDYVRRSLLRLRIVKGMSEELISAVIIRGIADPQLRASAVNAKLMPNELVDYFSIYVKPDTRKTNLPSVTPRNNTGFQRPSDNRKRKFSDGRCFSCGQAGHTQAFCNKRFKADRPSVASTSSNANVRPQSQPPTEPCSFCKKPGHKIDKCFAKQKAEGRSNHTVNFCRELEKGRSDISVAVIQGVPTDVLIDTGANGISLISSAVLKHFKCERKPAFRVIRGIGSQEIETTSYVTLPVEFDEVALEVDLFVVEDEYLNTPVIIGTDVLDRKGVTFIRKSDGSKYLRREDPLSVFTVGSDSHASFKTTLVGDDLKQLHQIIDEFSDSFISGTASSTVNTGSMSIKLNSDVPIKYRPYRLSQPETLRVREIVKDLLDKGVIQESESEYSSPILLVKKKNGQDRMCVDFRKLNEITVKDRFPLPRIDDHIDRLGQTKYFTSLDMATGFHQIAMEKESVPLTGFVTPEGHYEYLKMPYGLANAPVVYQRIIAKTLRDFIEPGDALVYIDDVLLLSGSVERGFVLLRQVLKTLTAAGFSINLAKCSFLCTEIEYLGRTISEGQVRPSAQKVAALVESPKPKNVKQVRQFIGLASYFRRYIPGFATKTACITKLTQKGVDFEWGDEQERVRREIIEYLTNEPVLAIYDPKLRTEVHTDASSIGYGAVLIQVHETGHKRVVAYFSRRTQGAESKYHSYDLETLAVVKALQHFRHYLIGLEFTVVTDCNALKLTQHKKDLLPRVCRWWAYLQDFNFSLEYRKGSNLAHADYLSRNPVSMCTVGKPHNWAQIAQAADEETQTLLQKLTDGQLDSNQYVKKNDVLYYKYCPVGEAPRLLCFIPKGHRLSLLRVFHDEHEHPGSDKTIDLIMKHFWFPGLRSFAQKYVSHCVVCLSHKKVPRAPHQPIHSWEKPDSPFETIHVDALGPLPESNGYRYVLIVVDAFSKYCLLYPMYKQETSELKKVLTNVVSLFGSPKLIVADRGRMFQSKDFSDWVTDVGSDMHFITPEMHQSNGQVERYCRTVLNMIRIETNFRNNEWSSVMWKLQLVLNITKHKTTQCSPLNLLVGIDGATPVIRSLVRDVALQGSRPNREALREMTRQRASERLVQNKTNQDDSVNKGRTQPRTFEINSLVFVVKNAQMTGKLDSGMRGPYRVVKALPHGRYELKLVTGSYGKTTQAAAEYMKLWRGEWTPEVCAAYFEGE